MAGRLWKHGIYSFLEILRVRRPGSHEHMLTFIHQAYTLLELLYESVPMLEDIWLNFLGDISRYGMFVDENSDDGNIWIGVSRQWYSLASEKSPSAGHLYHHLAILARSDAIQKLYLYAKLLCVALPFTETRKNIWTLFYPGPCERRLSWIDAAFICVHRILFSKKAEDLFYQASTDYLALLDPYISTVTKEWRTIGYQTAIALCCSMLDYGEESNFFINQIAPRQKEDTSDSTSKSTSSPNELFPKARDFAIDVYQLVASRVEDPNTLSFLHTFLVFVWRLSKLPAAIVHLERKFPWEITADMLNSILGSCGFEARMDSEEFPGALRNDTPRPLPEDFALRSLVFADKYFPSAWFENCKLEEQIELASMDGQRRERLLWLGCRIASTKQWLIWKNGQFTVQRGYI
ncbi:unnamed protein product [Clonostachys chloroleuca]|uniref:DNA/RNA-binding domain-containing protein n=1 Tax=Clonostachys chloroleuca TaxID=1926264 RepID=A0AA35M5A6_9HYPO|nr:unnamed protein product [Clonostachys chloroleuca]